MYQHITRILLRATCIVVVSLQSLGSGDCHIYTKIKPRLNSNQFEVVGGFQVDEQSPYQMKGLDYCQLMFINGDETSKLFDQLQVVMFGVVIKPETGRTYSSVTVYADSNIQQDLRQECERGLGQLLTDLRQDGLKVTTFVQGSKRRTHVVSITSDGHYQCGDYKDVPIILKATSEKKYIHSPFYPNKVLPNMHCIWNIESDDGFPVQVEVEGDFGQGCTMCYVIVADVSHLFPNPSPEYTLKMPTGYEDTVFSTRAEDQETGLNTYSQQWDPVTVRSVSRHGLQVRLNTFLSSFEPKGMRVAYYTHKFPPTNLTMENECRMKPMLLLADETERFLDFSITPNGLNLKLHRYRDGNKANCVWNIRSDDGHPIEVRILALDAEETSEQCANVSLTITREELDPRVISTDVLMRPLCDHEPSWSFSGKAVRSVYPNITVEFKTFDPTLGSRFRLKYSSKEVPSPDQFMWANATLITNTLPNEQTTPINGAPDVKAVMALNHIVLYVLVASLMCTHRLLD